MTKKKGRKVVILRGGKFPRHRGEAVAGNWVCVYQADVDMNHVKGHLRLKNPAYWSAVENDEPTEGLEPFIFLYREKGPYVFLPRHYKLQALRELTVRRVPMPPALCRQYKTKVKPRSFVQERALAAFEGKADGILCLACGQGKTKSSLMIAAAGKKFPVLVIVHTTALMDQWRKEIAATYEISEEEVGIIRGPKCEWQGRSISIAMLQSLSGRKYPKEFYEYWRLVISDECIAEGSLVRMWDGSQLPIEQVSTGMYVATPLGPRRVTNTSKSLHRDVVTVRVGEASVRVTPDHPIAKKVYLLDDKDSPEEAQRGEVLCLWEEALPQRDCLGQDHALRVQTAFTYRGELFGLPELCSVPGAYGAPEEEVQIRPSCAPQVRASETLHGEGGVQDLRGGCSRPGVQRGAQRPLLRQRCEPAELAVVQECGRDSCEAQCLAVESAEGQATALAFSAHEGQQPNEASGRPRSNQDVVGGWAPGVQGPVWTRRGWEGYGRHLGGEVCLGNPQGAGVRAGEVFRGQSKREGSVWGSDELYSGLLPRGESVGYRAGRQQPQDTGQVSVECQEGCVPGGQGDHGSAADGDTYALAVAASGGCDEARLEVEDAGEVSDVYDLTVEDAHCFFANDVLVHNCHRQGSTLWSKVVCRFPGQRIGLSATPTRPDGMDVAFRVHMGKVRYQYTKQTLSSEFVFVHTGINVPTPHMRNPMHRLAKVMSWVSKCDERNDIIASFLRKAYKEGRKVITLGDRVETLETLCRGYPGASKAVFVGKTKQGDERKEALSKDAIFATSSMAKEGLDVPRLDTLFITIPFSGEGRLEQSVGRILRECEGKMPPVTYVFVDRQPSLQKFAAVQKNWAERKGYKVTELFPGEY